MRLQIFGGKNDRNERKVFFTNQNPCMASGVFPGQHLLWGNGRHLLLADTTANTAVFRNIPPIFAGDNSFDSWIYGFYQWQERSIGQRGGGELPSLWIYRLLFFSNQQLSACLLHFDCDIKYRCQNNSAKPKVWQKNL